MPKPNPAGRHGGQPPHTRAEMQGTRSLVMNGELFLYGIVDPYDLFGEGDILRAIDVMASLAELADKDTIVVRVNSPGGSVQEGLAIYNALRASGKTIEMRIDAMAASIMSIIAMAGDRIVMAENASIMIHDPFGFCSGRAEDMRAVADEIDRQKAILVNIYAKRTGIEAAEIERLMAAETTMSAADAVERGFADEIWTDAPRIAACSLLSDAQMARLLAPPPIRAERPVSAAPAASTQKGSDMDPITTHGGTAPVAPPPVAPQVQALDENAIRNAAVAAERERQAGIRAQARSARIPVDDPFVTNLIENGRPLADARNDIMNEWSSRQDARPDNPSGGEIPGRIEVTADATDRWAQGAQRGLMIRAGLAKPEDQDRGNEFVGLTLVELARSSLNVRNIKSGGMDRMSMIGRAFTVRNAGPGMHSTSDFPTIIQNVAYRAVMQGYNEVDETFPLWTGKGTASDFRPIARVDLGLFPALDKVEEGAEYKSGTLGDNGTTVIVATYGKIARTKIKSRQQNQSLRPASAGLFVCDRVAA